MTDDPTTKTPTATLTPIEARILRLQEQLAAAQSNAQAEAEARAQRLAKRHTAELQGAITWLTGISKRKPPALIQTWWEDTVLIDIEGRLDALESQLNKGN